MPFVSYVTRLEHVFEGVLELDLHVLHVVLDTFKEVGELGSDVGFGSSELVCIGKGTRTDRQDQFPYELRVG
jgi:hypothetical protein